MISQSLPMLVYLAIMMLALAMPYASALVRPVPTLHRLAEWPAAVLVMATAVALTVFRHGSFSLLSVVLLVPLIGLGPRFLLGGIAAVLLFAPVTWWTPQLALGPVATMAFVGLALFAGYLPRLKATPNSNDDDKLILPMAICAALGLFAGLLTGPFGSSDTVYLAWHHWGAYISPVEAWLSGGLPYRDFPVQYGLGPTVLLATTCGNDCWRGLYGVAITANALYFAVLAGCALILTARMQRGMRWLALLALFCACLIWTGFPTSFAGPVMTPSVAGLRFLPIAALLFYILVAEQRAMRRDWVGHAIWAVNLLWSPETASFATVVWWPYLALRDMEKARSLPDVASGLFGGVLRATVALVIGLGTLTLTAWLLSDQMLTLSDFFAYVLHPPGPLPVNPVGTIWIALALVALALQLLARGGLSGGARSLYVCLIVLLAAGSYFLSRSHDNNILNLFPLLVIVALATTRQSVGSRPDFASGFVRTFLAAIVSFVATFNFGPWGEGVARGHAFDLGPSRLVARFTPNQSDSPRILPRDAVAGLEYLRRRNAGAVVLLSDRALMPWSPPGSGWTGVNNAANFTPLPDAMIVRYIKRGARAYRRPGWTLIDNAKYGHWVTMFATAYDVRHSEAFGTHTAYYLVPR